MRPPPVAVAPMPPEGFRLALERVANDDVARAKDRVGEVRAQRGAVVSLDERARELRDGPVSDEHAVPAVAVGELLVRVADDDALERRVSPCLADVHADHAPALQDRSAHARLRPARDDERHAERVVRPLLERIDHRDVLEVESHVGTAREDRDLARPLDHRASERDLPGRLRVHAAAEDAARRGRDVADDEPVALEPSERRGATDRDAFDDDVAGHHRRARVHPEPGPAPDDA